MKQIDFTKPGGFPLQQDTLDFMQEAHQELLDALVRWFTTEGNFSTGGTTAWILTGVVTKQGPVAMEVTPGWILRDGELLFFAGDTLDNIESAGGIGIVETTADATFKSGSTETVYMTKMAIAGGQDPIALGTYTRIINIADLRPVLARTSQRQQAVVAPETTERATFSVPGAVAGDVVVVSLRDVNPSGVSEVYGVTDYLAVRAQVENDNQVVVVMTNHHHAAPALGGLIEYKFRILK